MSKLKVLNRKTQTLQGHAHTQAISFALNGLLVTLTNVIPKTEMADFGIRTSDILVETSARHRLNCQARVRSVKYAII